MDIIKEIEEELKSSIKEKNELKTTSLRAIKSSLKNKEIESGKELTDEEIIDVISKEAKKRKESAEAFRQGNREDLAKKEEEELKIFEKYLPEQMNEEDIRKMVTETIKEIGAQSPADIGKVMGAVVPKTKGKADGSIVSKIAKEELEK